MWQPEWNQVLGVHGNYAFVYAWKIPIGFPWATTIDGTEVHLNHSHRPEYSSFFFFSLEFVSAFVFKCSSSVPGVLTLAGYA